MNRRCASRLHTSGVHPRRERSFEPAPARAQPSEVPAKRTTKPSRSASVTPDEFLRQLQHPCRAEILQLHDAILAVDPRILAGVKWNSLSFLTTEHFATLYLRATDEVQVVLHFGTKPRTGRRPEIADPGRLLEWRADDRALAHLGRGPLFQRNLPLLRPILQQWLQHL